MDSRSSVRVSHHAAARGVERHGHRDLAHATRALGGAYHSSLSLPRRLAGALLGARGASKTKGGVRVRVDGSTLLLCQGRKIVTTWRLSEGELATVLWWALTGVWTDDGGAPAATVG